LSRTALAAGLRVGNSTPPLPDASALRLTSKNVFLGQPDGQGVINSTILPKSSPPIQQGHTG